MTLTCVVFFSSPLWEEKPAMGLQLLATVYCKICYEHTQKTPNFALICVYVLCDISYIVVGLKRNYFFAKKIMDSEVRVEPTALLIMSHSHSFSRKIKSGQCNRIRQE